MTSLKRKRWPYLANRPVQANTALEVFDKFSGERVARCAFADAGAIDAAIAAARHRARGAIAAFPPDARRAVLEHCVARRARSENSRWRCASRPANRSATPAAK